MCRPFILHVQLYWSWTYGSYYAGGTVFDASQYAFFGNEVLEEVELGGLEDEEEDLPASKFEDEEYQLEQEEVFHNYFADNFL